MDSRGGLKQQYCPVDKLIDSYFPLQQPHEKLSICIVSKRKLNLKSAEKFFFTEKLNKYVGSFI